MVCHTLVVYVRIYSFTSDVLEQTPLITSYSYDTRLPIIARVPSRLSNSCKQSHVNADGDDEGGPSAGHVDEDERGPLFATASCPTKARILSRLIPPSKTKTKTKVCSPILDDAETGFFGVRCRYVLCLNLSLYSPLTSRPSQPYPLSSNGETSSCSSRL